MWSQQHSHIRQENGPSEVGDGVIELLRYSVIEWILKREEDGTRDARSEELLWVVPSVGDNVL